MTMAKVFTEGQADPIMPAGARGLRLQAIDTVDNPSSTCD